jgi:hypothetical protein
MHTVSHCTSSLSGSVEYGSHIDRQPGWQKARFRSRKPARVIHEGRLSCPHADHPQRNREANRPAAAPVQVQRVFACERVRPSSPATASTTARSTEPAAMRQHAAINIATTCAQGEMCTPGSRCTLSRRIVHRIHTMLESTATGCNDARPGGLTKSLRTHSLKICEVSHTVVQFGERTGFFHHNSSYSPAW